MNIIGIIIGACFGLLLADIDMRLRFKYGMVYDTSKQKENDLKDGGKVK